jgi:hypothetical protein
MSASNFNLPSLDPADNGSLAGVLQFVFKKMSQQVNGMLPAQVIAYDRTTNRVQVQLLIAQLTTSGATVSRPQLSSLPVLSLGGGGYTLNFPLTAGNLGWVVANDRDISIFLQNYSESAPNTTRMFSFSDGLFIPDVMTGFTIADEDTTRCVLQNLDGSVKVTLGIDPITSLGLITLKAPEVVIDANVTVTGSLAAEDGISVTGGSGFVVTGDMQLNGSFDQTGDMLVTGNIGATGTITPGV